MKQFKQFITEEIASETRQLTDLLVDSIYSEYVKKYNKNDVSCVGWLDGTENSEVRFRKIYEAGINNNDSISGNTYLNVNTLSDIKSIDKQFKKYLIEDVEYYHKYNNFEVLKDIVHAINKNVPKNSRGIIFLTVFFIIIRNQREVLNTVFLFY